MRQVWSFGHEYCDLVVYFLRQGVFKYFADFAHGGSLRYVGNNDVLVVEVFQQGCELVDVHVFAGLGSGGMLALVERALGDQNFAFDDILQLRKIDVLRIAEVGDNRELQGIVDFDALLL